MNIEVKNKSDEKDREIIEVKEVVEFDDINYEFFSNENEDYLILFYYEEEEICFWVMLVFCIKEIYWFLKMKCLIIYYFWKFYNLYIWYILRNCFKLMRWRRGVCFVFLVLFLVMRIVKFVW